MLIKKFSGRYAECPRCKNTLVVWSNGMPCGNKYCESCGCKLNYKLVYKDYIKSHIVTDREPNCVKLAKVLRNGE